MFRDGREGHDDWLMEAIVIQAGYCGSKLEYSERIKFNESRKKGINEIEIFLSRNQGN